MLASLSAASAAGVITSLSSHFVYTAGLIALGGALLHVRRNQLRAAAQHRQELALRKELLAYLLYNGSPRTMAAAELGRQISRLVAVRSSFGRAALMLRDEAGTLCVTGSAGFDDLSVEALNRWGRGFSANELSVVEIAAEHDRVGTSSFTLTLDRRYADRNPLSTMSCKKVHIIPVRAAHGIFGALVVCTELRLAAKASDALELLRTSTATPILPLTDLLQPMEALALRLTMQLAAPENVTPVWPARSPSRADRSTGRPDRHPDRHPDRQASRHARPAAASGDQPARPAEESGRRTLDQAASSLDPLGTAAALERVRQALTPAAAPVQRIAGVSGRPPARIWRKGEGLSLVR